MTTQPKNIATHSRRPFWFIGLLCLLTLAFTPLGTAAQDGDEITLNYEEADIQEVAQTISEVTGRNFIIDPRVSGRITVTSARPIPADAVYETFLSILDVHGFAAMEAGNAIKIVPSADARQMPGDGLDLDRSTFSDEIETRVINLDHVPAAQLVPILRPLVPQNAHLAAVSVSNTIVIADRASNIQRIQQLIDRIDQSPDNEIEVIRLEHASASEVVRVLTSLEQRNDRDNAAPLNLVADERSNSILLGGEEEIRIRMRALISHLDTPLEAGGNTRVRYLRYSDAETLAEVLREHVTQDQGGGGEGGQSRSGQGVSIVPDTGTNSLVITAPPREMREINGVIERLDIRRAQVLVEAIIVELSEDKTGELGVTWAAFDETGNNPVGLTRFPQSGADIGTIGGALQSDAPEQALQAAGSGLLFGIGRTQAGGIDFAALFRALAGDSQTNILSTPSLLTMDNEEAEIQVGQEVPFLTGSYTGPSGGGSDGGRGGGSFGNPFQTIQREDVGITLKITPRINEGNAVFLDIEQEVSSIASGVTGAQDLITNKRSIKTRVIVEDGEVIVLGGLIDEQLREQEQRVPILGAIPVLGNLFKSTTTTSEKRNLMVFLRPAILRGPEDTRFYTNAKYNRIRDLQQDSNQRVPLLHGVGRPQLEPIEQFRRGPNGTNEESESSDMPQLDMNDSDESGEEPDNGDQ